MDLYLRLQEKTNELDRAIGQLRAYGEQLADRERKYKIALASTCLRLKREGYAVGLIDKMCYGEEDVSICRFDRDIAKVYYESEKEHINSLKLAIRIIENQLAREYGR